jgi:menaquinone-specific isochorismate synthase
MTETAPPRTRRPDALAQRAGDRRSARRVQLPPGGPIDPLALAGNSRVLMADAGRFLVGVGTAMTITLPGGLADPVDVDRAMAELAAVECDDRLPAANSALRAVLAFGAFPFDRSAPAALVIPATLYCREPDGTEWATVLDGPDETPVQLRARLVAIAAAHPSGPSGPSRTQVVPRGDDATFEAAVAAAVSAIRRGELTKVVLARRIDVTLDQAPDLAALLRRWRSLEPSGTLFSLPTSHGQFVGASPELLVERTGRRVRSRPLAGTTSSPLPPELLESAKDTEEHRLVVDAIREALAPCCEELTIPDRPELVHLHNLTHLGTVIDGRLRTDSLQPIPSALHLVALLHPTPAVGGVPRSVALDLIARLEDGPRGFYAGPVGYLDGSGDGRFVVGIRAMTVAGRTATLTAGVGVVSGSHPETERDEAELKFMAVFDALAPGTPFSTSG